MIKLNQILQRIYTYLLIMVLVFTGFTSYSQKFEGASIKKLRKDLVGVKPGLYASKYEVTNQQYRYFLQQLKNQNLQDKLTTCAVDSMRWEDALAYPGPYKKMYFRHEAYDNYPVVNITYKAAKLFCEWLTNKYNNSRHKKFEKVQFRLPTELEWKYAAGAGNENAFYGCIDPKSTRYKDREQCNYAEPDSLIGDTGFFPNDNVFLTGPVSMYKPNDFGLYNMSGNVAEMVSEKGLVKGGSWISSKTELKINHTPEKINLDMGHPTVGFRVFMEVIEK